MSEETDRIEADINESRHRLNDTLDRLGSKLSPGQMLDEVLGLAQGQAGQFTANLGRQVRDNPMPVILIAAGIGMYLMNRQQQHHGNGAWSADDWHADTQYRSLEDARWRMQRQPAESDEAFQARLHDTHAQVLKLRPDTGEATDAFKQRVSDTVHGIESKASAARARMTQAASGTAHAMSAGMHRIGAKAGEAKHKAQSFYDDTPLAVGAMAIALGAIVGSATPLTSTERRTLSDVAQKAADASAQMAEKGAQALEKSPEAIH